MSLTDDLLSVVRQLVPESCPRCGLQSGRGFCPGCLADFCRIRSPCSDCGLPRPCRPCPAETSAWHADQVIAPFVYAAPLSGFIQSLKYSRQRYLGAILGELLANAVRACPDIDFIVPVPLHRRRLRDRHFNQADEIARPVARSSGKPLRAALVTRVRATAPQASLDQQQRWLSVQRAFSVRPGIDGAHVAVVDDVITTGATVNALAMQLKLAGAAKVSVLAVARAVAPGTPDDQPARKM
jgi:ComF family protein